MAEAFDPYRKWLGIPPAQQPPHHYRLLGIELYEADVEVIDTAASQRMSYLQELSGGPHVKESQRLLNEVSAARRCLLDPKKKAEYDDALRVKLAAAAPAADVTETFAPVVNTGRSSARPLKNPAKPPGGDADETIVIELGKGDATFRGRLPGLGHPSKDAASTVAAPSFDAIEARNPATPVFPTSLPTSEPSKPNTAKSSSAKLDAVKLDAVKLDAVKRDTVPPDAVKLKSVKSNDKKTAAEEHGDEKSRSKDVAKPKRKRIPNRVLAGGFLAATVLLGGGLITLKIVRTPAESSSEVQTIAAIPVETPRAIPPPTRQPIVASPTKLITDPGGGLAYLESPAKGKGVEKLPSTAASRHARSAHKAQKFEAMHVRAPSMTGTSPIASKTDVSKSLEQPFTPRWPPRPHFIPHAGLLGRLRGFFRSGDDYHLFYEVFARQGTATILSVRHAVTRDLLNWTETPVRFFIGDAQQPLAGSVIFDRDDAAGLGAEGRGALIAACTATASEKNGRRDILVAYSRDDGVSWKPLEKNPVLEEVAVGDSLPRLARDPVTKKWWLVLRVAGATSQQAETTYGLYSSVDLRSWESVQDIKVAEGIGGADFCPIQTGEGPTLWLLTTADGHYRVLKPENGKFVEAAAGVMQAGDGAVGYRTMDDGDPRAPLQLAVLRSTDNPKAMVAVSRPQRLKLTASDDGFRLGHAEQPLPPKWSAAPQVYENYDLDPTQPLAPKETGSTFHLDLNVAAEEAQALEVVVFGVPYKFDFLTGVQSAPHFHQPLTEKMVQLRGIVDEELVEWMTGDGTATAVYTTSPGPGVIPLQIKASGGKAKILQLTITPLRPPDQPNVTAQPANSKP